MTDDLGLADLEYLVIGVEGGVGMARRYPIPRVRRAYPQLYGLLHGHGVAGVEDGGPGQRLEHGEVLQHYLAGAVHANTDPTVAARGD